VLDANDYLDTSNTIACKFFAAITILQP